MGGREKLGRGIFIVTVLFLTAAAVAGAAVLTDRASALMLTAASGGLLIAMLAFSGRKNEPIYISLVSVMSALSVTGRIVFAPFAGFKPCTALVIITGITLGADAGFVCGALTAMVSNIYFGQGTWTLYQMLTWGIIGLLSGAMSGLLKKRRVLLYTWAAVSGVLYSVTLDVFSTLWEDGYFNPIRFSALAAGSLGYSAVYAISNIVFIALMYSRLTFAIERVKLKYGIEKTVN